MATHSSILAWKIPWTERPGRGPWGLRESDTAEVTSASLGRLLSSPWEGLFTVFTGQNTTEYFVLNLMLSL